LTAGDAHEAAADARQRASTAASAVLAAPPWSEIASRALLLCVDPPVAAWAVESRGGALWLVVDATEARLLPAEQRERLALTGSYGAGVFEDFEVNVLTSEGLARALDGVNRQALELRWMARHAQPLHDPLHRAEGLAAIATRLPADALERIVRPLYVQVSTALSAFAQFPTAGQPETAVILAGEAAAALTRLACVLEEGSHPPAQWLVPAARETRLGQRIAAWLNDVGPAVAGDARAARWVRESGAGVLREAGAALHAEFAGRDWLVDPKEYARRLPR
jgi:hypothetical protein